jgi:hypothetical protein
MVDKVRSRVGLPTMSKVWTNSKFREAKGYTATTAEAALNTTVTLDNGATSNEFMEELLDERLELCRAYGLIYYYRTGEKEEIAK